MAQLLLGHIIAQPLDAPALDILSKKSISHSSQQAKKEQARNGPVLFC
jgi:hypothetical protein